jgi:hypothetical protein
MLTTNRHAIFLASLIVLGFAGSTALAADAPAAMTPETMAWGDAPPVLPPGAKIAVLSGNPMAEGPFVLRLQFPAGYDVPAHFHSGDELITVISGTFGIGHGDALDREKGQILPVGGFVEMPAGHHHFAWAETETVVQIHGPGPFDITYLNPADDPLTQ